MKRKIRQSIKRMLPLPLHIYLIYLAVCTLLATGVTFSGYASGAEKNDTADVAAGIVTVTALSDTELEMEYPEDGSSEAVSSFKFSVTNENSQVAVQYRVSVSLEAPLPDGVTMWLDGAECQGKETIYTSEVSWIFEAGNQETKEHTVEFYGDYSAIKEQSERNITISVQAEQID